MANSHMINVPSFRYDLLTEVREEGSYRYVDVSCSDNGNFFRFHEVEYAVACGMDGKRDLGELVAWAKSELDLETTKEEVAAVAHQLMVLNYLEAVPELESSEPVLELHEPTSSDRIPVVSHSPVKAEPLAAAPTSPAAAAATSGFDFELGNSGKSEMTRPRTRMPTEIPELELGDPGKTSSPAKSRRPRPDTSSMELGVAGNESAPEFSGEVGQADVSSVSDLSQSFQIDGGDVQAAVQASKVSPPATPAETANTSDLGLEITGANVDGDEVLEPLELPIASLGDISAQIAEYANETTNVDDGGGSGAISFHEPRAKVASMPATSVQGSPRSKSSAAYFLWALLLLAVVLGAVYYYRTFVLENSEHSQISPSEGQNNGKTAQALVPPNARLTVGKPVVATVVSTRSGEINSAIEQDTKVSEGDVLASFKGVLEAQSALRKNQDSLEGYASRLERRRMKGSSRNTKLEAKVAEKQAAIERISKRLESMQIKASTGGRAELLVVSGDKVTPETIVAKITSEATLLAVFSNIPNGVNGRIGDEITLVSTTDRSLSMICTVVTVEGRSMSLECPKNMPVGTEVSMRF